MIFLTSEEDLKVSGLQIFYAYASWMPWHKKMLVMIDKFEEKFPDLSFIAIDTDYFKSLVRRWEIKQIPTMLVLDSGKELGRLEGLPLTSAFNAFCSIYTNRKDKNHAQAS